MIKLTFPYEHYMKGEKTNKLKIEETKQRRLTLIKRRTLTN